MDKLTYLVNQLDTLWSTSTGGTKPTITSIFDIKRFDLAVNDYIVVQPIITDSEIMGISHQNYTEEDTLALIISTKTSRTRMFEIIDEVKRIIKYLDSPQNSGLLYALIGNGEDITNKKVLHKYVLKVFIKEVV